MKSLRNTRLDAMENMVIDKGSVSLKELSQAFDISINTVRNDVENILQRGRIKKVYGGLTAISHDVALIEYNAREDSCSTFKREVCKKAAELIEDGDIIFIDSGTTTIHLVEHLKNKKNVKVLTNNIAVISMLLSNDDVQVIGLGGKVINKTKSFAGVDSLEILKSYNIQKAFMAATAVNIKNGVMNSSTDERNIKSMVVEKAEEVYLLVDSSKFGKNALLTYCELSDLDAIVTDKNNPIYIELLSKEGIRII